MTQDLQLNSVISISEKGLKICMLIKILNVLVPTTGKLIFLKYCVKLFKQHFNRNYN